MIPFRRVRWCPVDSLRPVTVSSTQARARRLSHNRASQPVHIYQQTTEAYDTDTTFPLSNVGEDSHRSQTAVDCRSRGRLCLPISAHGRTRCFAPRRPGRLVVPGIRTPVERGTPKSRQKGRPRGPREGGSKARLTATLHAAVCHPSPSATILLSPRLSFSVCFHAVRASVSDVA